MFLVNVGQDEALADNHSDVYGCRFGRLEVLSNHLPLATAVNHFRQTEGTVGPLH